jgi:nitroreductase
MTVALKSPRVPDHVVDPQFTGRWSPRAFAAETMSEETLLGLLEAARWAPSAVNVQPWRFAWGLRGDAGFAAIAGALVPFNGWAKEAAALVAVASKTTRKASDGSEVANPSHAFDAGAAWANLALQAHLAGWAAHGMGGFDAEAAAKALDLPEGHVIHAIVAIGRIGDPASLPEALRAREVPSPRLPLSALAGHGKFPG